MLNKISANKKSHITNNYLNYPSLGNVREIVTNFLYPCFVFSLFPMAEAVAKGFFIKGASSNTTYIYGYENSVVSDEEARTILTASNAEIVSSDVDLSKISMADITTVCFYQTPPSEGSLGDVVLRLTRNITELADASFENKICQLIDELGKTDPETKAIILGVLGGLTMAAGLAALGYRYRNEIKNKYELFFHRDNTDSASLEEGATVELVSSNESPRYGTQ